MMNMAYNTQFAADRLFTESSQGFLYSPVHTVHVYHFLSALHLNKVVTQYSLYTGFSMYPESWQLNKEARNNVKYETSDQ